MVFSSVVFLFYFLPLTILLYYTLGRIDIRLRNIILLIASLVFYAWGEPQYVFLLVFSCLFNWLMALLVGPEAKRRKFCVVMTCVVNLGILFVFKYWDFTMSSINTLIDRDLLPLYNIALPIGISFFTFQAMSYVIDVYRGDVPAQKNPLNVMLYVSLFPQLVAGPIVRYHTVEDQILHRTHSWKQFSEGSVRFVQGFAKKLILANAFATIADNIYDLTLAGHTILVIPVSLAWLGSFAYTFQIFLDFSAYSDMAIGLGKMFGFTFEENFVYPYISRSIGEFWRRWHISLSTWFREYVYFPLGGSRMGSIDGVFRNMLIVWILTGLWHGAAWNFLFWGLLNYLFLVIERITMLEKRPSKGIWRHVYTLIVVNFGWVLFRCESFYHLQEYLGNMFGMYHNPFFSSYTWMFLREYFWFWVIGICISFPVFPALRKYAQAKLPRVESVLYPVGMIGIFLLSVVYLSKSGYNPFIYFNF